MRRCRLVEKGPIYAGTGREALQLARDLTGCSGQARKRGSRYVIRCSDGRTVLVRVRSVVDVEPYVVIDYVLECHDQR